MTAMIILSAILIQRARYGNPSTSQTSDHPTVNYSYDSIGRLSSLTDQAGAITSFVYDNRGLIISRTDPPGNITNFYYDGAGRWKRHLSLSFASLHPSVNVHSKNILRSVFMISSIAVSSSCFIPACRQTGLPSQTQDYSNIQLRMLE
jgi:YD repeat-containing protein